MKEIKFVDFIPFFLLVLFFIRLIWKDFEFDLVNKILMFVGFFSLAIILYVRKIYKR